MIILNRRTKDKTHRAKEKMSIADILRDLPMKRRMAGAVLSRLTLLTLVPDKPIILDIGAAQGETCIAFRELGYYCIGIEPSSMARENAWRLSHSIGIPIEMVGGVAEAIPFAAESFDLVFAASVIEHVRDLEKTFKEICRVLRPGGVFWFHTASAMCPKQDEIASFPLFGWYPDNLKKKIMHWAKQNKPELIGYTQTPAMHWFTPRKARRLLLRHGFSKVFDRWDLLTADVNLPGNKFMAKLISSSSILKCFADVARTGCSYTAVK